MKCKLRFEALEERDVPAAGSTQITVATTVDYTLSINSYGRVATMQLTTPEWLAWSDGSQTQAQVYTMAQRLYQHFPDDFDNIFLVNNQVTAPPTAVYNGVTYPVKNDTLGIGQPTFDDTALYGSSGKLQTFIHLIQQDRIRVATSLHEFLHRVAAFLPELQSTVAGHWGFSSVGGHLGGWEPGTLTQIGPGLYDADGPNGTTDWFANSSYTNAVGYAQLELYLLGLIDATQVDPIQYATNGAFTNQALGQFSADSIQTLTANNIIAQEGLRLPTPATSQKNFRELVVVLTPNPLTQGELDQFDTDVELFGRPGSDGDPTLKNFWEATGGRATMTMDGLDKYLPYRTPFLGIGTTGVAQGYTLGSTTGKYDTLVFPNIAAYFGANPDQSIRTAVGDVDGDGLPDFAIATGPGVATRFGVISGDQSRFIIAPSAPFAGSEDFTGGAFVSVGDLDGDGRSDVVVSADETGGPRVTIYSFKPSVGTYRLADILGIADASFRGGARTAVGDMNHDGRADLAVAAGPGGGPRAVVYNGATLFTTRSKLVNDFFAYPGSDAVNLRNGIYLSIGDVNADGWGDLVTGAGNGGAPRVLALNGQLLINNSPLIASANPLADFFSGSIGDRGGVRVAVKNVDNDARMDIVTGSGIGLTGDVRVYKGSALRGRAQPPLYQDLPIFGDQAMIDGIFVG